MHYFGLYEIVGMITSLTDNLLLISCRLSTELWSSLHHVDAQALMAFGAAGWKWLRWVYSTTLAGDRLIVVVFSFYLCSLGVKMKNDTRKENRQIRQAP